MPDSPHHEIEVSKKDFLEFLREFNASADMQRAAAQESGFLAFYNKDDGFVEHGYGDFHLWLLNTLGFRKEARHCREWRDRKLKELEQEKPKRPYDPHDPDWMFFQARWTGFQHGGFLAQEARATMMLAGHPTLTAIPGRIVERLGKRRRRRGLFDWTTLALTLIGVLVGLFAALVVYPCGRRLFHVPDPAPSASPVQHVERTGSAR